VYLVAKYQFAANTRLPKTFRLRQITSQYFAKYYLQIPTQAAAKK